MDWLLNDYMDGYFKYVLTLFVFAFVVMPVVRFFIRRRKRQDPTAR